MPGGIASASFFMGLPVHIVAKATVAKVDQERRLVFGWASVAIDKSGQTVTDSYDDQIDIEELENAAYQFTLHFRELNAEHEGPARGALVESMVFTQEKAEAMGIPEGVVPEGWWVGFYVEDDDAWALVKSGKYPMFSIEGWASREEAA